MRFEFFVAKRYLVSKHKLNFITVISFISGLGITIGVAALIVVLSVFNGFSGIVTSILMDFDPHLRVAVLTDENKEKIDSIQAFIKNKKNIKECVPFVSGKAVIFNKNYTGIASIKAFDYENSDYIWGPKGRIVMGDFNLDPKKNDQIVIGIVLASRLQVMPGDTIILSSFYSVAQSAASFQIPLSRKYVVKGIFSSYNKEYDGQFAFVSLRSGQSLLGYRNKIEGFEIRFDDIKRAESFKNLLFEKYGDKINASTWRDLHKNLYLVMQIERWAAYIILSMIIGVAAFNVLGSLSMSVIEKKKDISVLRAIGTKQNSLIKIFMFEGLIIGALGTIVGMALGYVVCILQIKYKIYPLDPGKYILDALPVIIDYYDFLWVGLSAFLISTLASLYPSFRASKLSIIDSIKWE